MTLAGSYEAVFRDRGQLKTITLDCPSETRCAFAFPGDVPMQTTDVRPVDDPQEARFALGYAAEHVDASPSQDAEPFDEPLAGLLHAAPEVATCWDIDDHDRDYLLACRLRSAGRIDPRIFIFATVLASCGPKSCRFEIIPLTEKRR